MPIPGVEQAAEQEFPFVVIPPQFSFLRENIPPAEGAYVGPGGGLMVWMWSALPGVAALMDVRLLMPDGQVQPNQYRFDPAGDYTAAAGVIQLPESMLLSLSVRLLGVAPPGGFYVQCVLAHNPGGNPVIQQTLVCGYLVSGSGLTYPNPRFVGPAEGPGRIRIITGTDPAAGAMIVETVPAGARWRLLSFAARLVTAAAGPSRYVRLQIHDGAGGLPVTLMAQGAQPGGSVYDYNYAVGIARAQDATLTWFQDALPAGLYLTGGHQVYLGAAGMQAGDNWGAPLYVVEEWIEP